MPQVYIIPAIYIKVVHCTSLRLPRLNRNCRTDCIYDSNSLLPLKTMDFSSLNEAIASKSYDKVADICDNLMLQVAAEGVTFHNEWPYVIHLLGHVYADDINSARFLWKKIPQAIKDSQPELVAAWRICQKLWVRDYAGVHEAIKGFNWSPETQGLLVSYSDLYVKNVFGLLLCAYSTISIQDAALFLGMTEDEAAKYALQEGWTLDPATRMLTVVKQPTVPKQKLDPSKLQRLTEYVFHLEH